MATLYKRATAQQYRILRIVEGAVKNAADAHGANISPRMRRSIAKRAAGTLTAQWPDVLAAQMPSDRAISQRLKSGPSEAKLWKPRKRGAVSLSNRTPPSFKELHKRLGLMAGWARKAGHEGRAAAFADALRVVANLEKELST